MMSRRESSWQAWKREHVSYNFGRWRGWTSENNVWTIDYIHGMLNHSIHYLSGFINHQRRNASVRDVRFQELHGLPTLWGIAELGLHQQKANVNVRSRTR